MLKNVIRLSVCLLFVLGGAVDYMAQQPAVATLRGIITDPNGAVVPGATVRVTQTATGARLSDTFNSLDMRVSKVIKLGDRVSIEPIAEVFNLLNVTNVLGVSNVNYSGYSNVLVRDSSDPSSAGFLRSTGFGRAVTTAGGVFGSGGPRAFQFAVRLTF